MEEYASTFSSGCINQFNFDDMKKAVGMIREAEKKELEATKQLFERAGYDYETSLLIVNSRMFPNYTPISDRVRVTDFQNKNTPAVFCKDFSGKKFTNWPKH